MSAICFDSLQRLLTMSNMYMGHDINKCINTVSHACKNENHGLLPCLHAQPVACFVNELERAVCDEIETYLKIKACLY